MKQKSLYENIVEWLKDKPLFVQDSARRLLHNAVLLDNDKKEIFNLLKKECGFDGIELEAQVVTLSDIPSTIADNQTFPKLLSIKKPVNINALSKDTELSFAPDGITIVYGPNGAGKSSYARILKRCCWSRDKKVEILTNVFEPSDEQQGNKEQSVIIETDTKEYSLRVNEEISEPELNSIYVFDSICSSIYVDRETDTHYKPAEIDLLEDIVDLLNDLSQTVLEEEEKLDAVKPDLPNVDYGRTGIYSWYQNIEQETPEKILSNLTVTDEHKQRYSDLEKLLFKNDPSRENQELEQKKARYESLKGEILKIEKAFSKQNFQNIKDLKDEYNVKKGAYELSKEMIEKYDKLAGVGSDSWRLLWQAAKEYATKEVHPDTSSFPSSTSSNICVLCQQNLDEEAKKRQVDFDTFIKSDASAKFYEIKRAVTDKQNQIKSMRMAVLQDTVAEINQEIDGFKDKFDTFNSEVINLQNNWIDFLDENKDTNEILISAYVGNLTREESQDSTIVSCQEESTETQTVDNITYTQRLECISESVTAEIVQIDKRISANNKLLKDRPTLEHERDELGALLYLEDKRSEIMKYIEEHTIKEKYKLCKENLNTASYSKKIGELLTTNSIDLLRKEFTSILSSLDSELASKICLAKTRTENGVTYYDLRFSGINGNINSVLSEGQLKIISLSGFLAECTVGGSKNTIVFDDPVNSLDDIYREAIANKLVELGKDIQVIVFTHELYFLSALMYRWQEIYGTECRSLSLNFVEDSVMVDDEIPFLVKNIQQRIDNIRKELEELSSLSSGRDSKLYAIRNKMRLLVEISVEEILANGTIRRFSKNITVKKDLLASYVVTDKSDIGFLLALYRKYSTPVHDGGLETVAGLPNEKEIKKDLKEFSDWRDKFKDKLEAYKKNEKANS